MVYLDCRGEILDRPIPQGRDIAIVELLRGLPHQRRHAGRLLCRSHSDRWEYDFSNNTVDIQSIKNVIKRY